ncbi:MAG: prephenate dehydratase [Actinobacteria bacterium]|uniref:prephenate dehydratase n=1 Tax=freshwater metagenome TaxID=449393 RepID=A0A6J6GB86_9ZZZZ|nr:prephenate dehydratase [Actinomycetota bacterium]
MSYAYLGPVGTFTWIALGQVEEARGAEWLAVNNVGEALAAVERGDVIAAMIAVENSIEGGVSAAQDALASSNGLQILGEYLVPVNFDVVVRSGTDLPSVRVIEAHPVAYAQCRTWLEKNLPRHEHLPATSNVAAAIALNDTDRADAAIAPHGYSEHADLVVVGDNVGDNPNAVTRFVLIGRRQRVAAPTGTDKTTLIVELPDDRPGGLLEMLEQFATRGVNLSLLESRPIGDELGRYRFVIDLDGHVEDERVADALLGLKRFSPRVQFLGSYRRADGHSPAISNQNSDAAFADARTWLARLIAGEEV